MENTVTAENVCKGFTYCKVSGLKKADIKDTVGQVLGIFLAKYNRKENIEKLRCAIIAVKQFIADSYPTETLYEDIELALGRLEERLGEFMYDMGKSLKAAKIYVTGWALALGALLLDRRWSVLFKVLY